MVPWPRLNCIQEHLQHNFSNASVAPLSRGRNLTSHLEKFLFYFKSTSKDEDSSATQNTFKTKTSLPARQDCTEVFYDKYYWTILDDYHIFLVLYTSGGMAGFHQERQRPLHISLGRSAQQGEAFPTEWIFFLCRKIGNESSKEKAIDVQTLWDTYQEVWNFIDITASHRDSIDLQDLVPFM